jgi:hypothetical protein
MQIQHLSLERGQHPVITAIFDNQPAIGSRETKPEKKRTIILRSVNLAIFVTEM